MSSPDDDRPTCDLDDDAPPQPTVGRLSAGWTAVRAWRPRLVHGLVAGLALVMGAGVWAGFGAAADDDTDSATVAATIAPRGDSAAGRDEARAEPSPSDTPSTSQAEKPTPKDPQTTEAESQSDPQPDSTSTAKPKSTAGCESYSGNQAVACGLLGDFGFGTEQMECLAPLWEHESGWSTSASNPSSGAYGIPQALPGDKMASAGGDWQNSAATQISWGLGYIADRYGDPCGAWGFWQSNNWY